MRALLLAKDSSWPRDTGLRQRLDAVTRGLAGVGQVHVVVVAAAGEQVPEPAPAHVARLSVLRAPWRGPARAAVRHGASRLPRAVTGRDWSPVHRGLAGLDAVDLVWCAHADVWAGVRASLPGAPVVVDLDNVMSALVGRRAAATPGPLGLALRDDARRWARLERRVLAGADAVTVCSALDAARLRPADPADRLVVLPNGGDALPGPAPAPERPVLLLVASLDYPPNSEAALWCATRVLPRVREQVPDAVLRVVGRPGRATERLQGLDGVEVAGRVEHVADELRRAAVAVVPLLHGGGTRIKALEAFGAGLPVVATTVGVEGIDAVPGRHLLVADAPEDFAAACVRLLLDRSAAAELGAAARALHAERYSWAGVRAAVTRLAGDVARKRRGVGAPL